MAFAEMRRNDVLPGSPNPEQERSSIEMRTLVSSHATRIAQFRVPSEQSG
jgi:hypothetical protein